MNIKIQNYYDDLFKKISELYQIGMIDNILKCGQEMLLHDKKTDKNYIDYMNNFKYFQNLCEEYKTFNYEERKKTEKKEKIDIKEFSKEFNFKFNKQLRLKKLNSILK